MSPSDKLLEEARRLGINTSNPAVLATFVSGDIDAAVTMSKPGGIRAGEAAGASAMLASNNLPKKGLVEYRETLEQIGFVFGDEIDKVLISVQLPEGWRKEREWFFAPWSSCQAASFVEWEHSKLVDGKGRKRAHVFLKVTSYDYTGYVNWHSRFNVNVIFADGRDGYALDNDEEALLVGVVMDGSTEIHRTEPQTATRRNYKVEEHLRNDAYEWLVAKYPDAEKPFAHWDDCDT
ncbi:hypothetical protein FJZ28_04885 [Candidatus Peregrinibacteria bacterium]|nr:hypothetical protein [Candidatus Peregrinibacteria bacterium]